jgi:hypothetical protein
MKLHFSHWLTPIKPALGAIGGVLGALLATESMTTLLWWIFGGFSALLIILRTVVLFEFREHERRETKLLTALNTTSDSFDTVARILRDELKGLRTDLTAINAALGDLKSAVENHNRRLAAIEDSPVGRRYFAPQLAPTTPPTR